MSDLFLFDQKIREENSVKLIAGFDEAGRGPLAGPISCAVCVLRPNFDSEMINDSKKLTDKKRREIFNTIIENSLFYHVELVPVEIIDEINILNADLLGMDKCLSLAREKVHVDYLILDYLNIKSELAILSIAKGDATSLSVAAASILAKVTRDDFMLSLDKRYPEYEFKKNKGYGTKKHLEAIKSFGYLEGIHRKTFEPIRSIIKKEEDIKLF